MSQQVQQKAQQTSLFPALAEQFVLSKTDHNVIILGDLHGGGLNAIFTSSYKATQ